MKTIQELTREKSASPQKIDEMIQSLDRDLERGMISAEKKAAKRVRPAWSPALIQCQAKVNYYKCWMSEIRTGVKQEKQRRYYRKKAGKDFTPEEDSPPALKDEYLILTTSKVFGWFKNWKLRTSTSPSGLHLGLWKSAIGVVFPEKKEASENYELEDDSKTNHEEILEWITSHLELVRTTGVIPERWQKTVNLMLEKIPGRPFVNKIRIIHILEADMNAFFGQQWCRDLQVLAERHNLLGEEQWGSRKGRSAPEVALLKVLTYEVMHLTKTDGATFDNDAKSCFDRIVRNIMMLVSRKLGMTKEACKTFVRFLLGMRFYQHTEAGISEEFFETFKNKLQGVGQGAKWSAIMWSQISPILMWLLEKKSGGLTFQDPLRRKTIRRSADGFVDDVTAWINCFDQIANDPHAQDHESLPKLVKKMEEAAQYWEQLLNATGGKLELPKCFYYILHWNFNKEGEASLSKKEEIPHEIKLTESQTGEVC